MILRRLWRPAACFGAGGLAALSIPPWGWWPLAFAAIAVVAWATEGAAAKARWWSGVAFGTGMFGPGLWWMIEFHALGAVLVMLLETAFVAGAIAAAPPGRWRVLAFPAAMVLAEGVRSTVPFGGLPLAGLPLGQVAGPLGPVARLGGELLVLWTAAAVGAAWAEAARRRTLAAAVGVGCVVAVSVVAALAPDGGPAVRRIDVALVQGGGPRGFRAVDTDPNEVFERHLAASENVRRATDLVVWPEDVVDVARPVLRTDEGARLSELADRLDATLVAGVVEDIGDGRFANAAVSWDPEGTPGGRYDKVRRVPFGEYVPGRSLIDRVADLSVIPRDAVPGTGAGRLRTEAGDVAVAISYEVFFADRARAGVRAGGRMLLVPTNAASFSTSQVPTTQLAAARLRALETGRDVLQAAPTGYTAVVDHQGRVRQRSVLGRRQVLHDTAALRRGTTVYLRLGDAPVAALAAAALAAAWWRERRQAA